MSNIVHLQDCTEGMKQLPDKSIEWAVCDIPYGISVTKMPFLKENKTTVKQKNGTRLNPHKNKTITSHNHWDQKPPSQQYFDELCRVTKKQIIFGIDYTNWSNVGPGRIKWNKGFDPKVSFNQFEVAYCSEINCEITLNLLWAGFAQAKSLSEPMTQQGNKKLNEKRIHPCYKPVLLYALIFKTFGISNTTILDTHIGGGSIRIAADWFNNDLLGYEIDPDYHKAQEKRYLDFTKQLTLNFKDI